MGRKLEIKKGERYGRLTIIEEVEPKIQPSGQKERRFRCKCDCGCSTIVWLSSLRRGDTTSCGCLQKERMLEVNSKKIKTNKYDLSDNKIGVGYTFKGEKFLFDKESYELIKDYSWYIDNNGYVVTKERTTGKCILLHRLVMGVDNNLVVDHINHDTTNNCKQNLRVCSQRDNAKNKRHKKNSVSGVTGVIWDKPTTKWRAIIRANERLIHLGRFTSKADAVKARIKAELEIFGEYAPTYYYFTEEQREAILDDTMQPEDIVEILKLNQYIDQCV